MADTATLAATTGTTDDEPVENIYDEIEIDDMDFDEDDNTFYYPCPCGDKFRLSLKELRGGEVIATCPSCSLQIKIISDEEYLNEFLEENGLSHLL